MFTPPPRVVRNHLRNGKWGPEESHGQYFPFSANESFEILILVSNEGYKIAINGTHFAEFTHRISYHEVSHLAIDGDTTISQILFEEAPLPSAPPSTDMKSCPYPTGPVGMPVPGNFFLTIHSLASIIFAFFCNQILQYC